MEYDQGLLMCLASGLVLLIIGTAFFRDRILYLKKSHIAIATMFKQEEIEDNEGGTDYVPFFKFTTRNNIEVIFEHRSTQSKSKWTIGDKLKIAYREGLTDIYDQLPLTFYDVFGLPTGLLVAGIFILLVAVGIYFDLSNQTLLRIIPASLVVFVVAFYVWAQNMFKKLT